MEKSYQPQELETNELFKTVFRAFRLSLSGPTKEHPLPSIFHHKVFKTTNVGGFCFNIAYAYVHKYKIIILHMCN